MATATTGQPVRHQSEVDAIFALVIVALLIAMVVWARWRAYFARILVVCGLWLASLGFLIAYFASDASPWMAGSKGSAVLSLCAFQMPRAESRFQRAHWFSWAILTAAFGGIGLWQLVDSGLEILWAVPIVGPFCLVALTLSLLAQRAIIRRTAKIQTSETTQPSLFSDLLTQPSLFSPSDLLSLASDIVALLGSAACLAITIMTNMSLAGLNCAIATSRMLWKLFKHWQAERQQKRAGQLDDNSARLWFCHSRTRLTDGEPGYHQTLEEIASTSSTPPHEVPKPAVPSQQQIASDHLRATGSGRSPHGMS